MNGKLVLVVNHDAAGRMSAVDWVRAFGGTPIQAASGRDALGMLQTMPDIEVVISTLHMPSGDGLDLHEQARPLLEERGTVFVWWGDPLDDLMAQRIKATGREHFPLPTDLPPVMEHIRAELASARPANQATASERASA